MKEPNNKETSMSTNQQRKLQRKQEIIKRKREAMIGKITGIGVSVILVGGIIALGIAGIYRAATKVTADTNYSAQINEDGTIKGVKASDYVTLGDYKNLKISSADITYSEEDLDKDIEKILEEHTELSTTTTAVAADGDKVNIDYVGTIDGVAFNGGDTAGNGYDIILGSGNLIDDFEEQIIGHSIGDSFEVAVTFPEEYPNNPDLAGKDAIFSVVLNGIYVKPEFNDHFVLQNFSDVAATAEDYRAYLKASKEDENLTTKIREALVDSSEVIRYPKDFLKQVKALKKYEDLSYYQNVNNYYASYLGDALYPTFSSYIGMTEAKYDRTLEATGKAIVKQTLIYQAIAENEGITANEADYLTYFKNQGQTDETFQEYLTNYGKGYLMQQHISIQVMDFIKKNTTVQ